MGYDINGDKIEWKLVNRLGYKSLFGLFRMIWKINRDLKRVGESVDYTIRLPISNKKQHK